MVVMHARSWALCHPVPDAGALLERLGRGEEARADYTRAIELDASAALSHNARCAASLQRAWLRRAQGAHASQGSLIVGHVSAAHRGLLLERMGATADAAADFDAAIALEPTSAAFVRNRGMCHRACGELGAAVACFTRALQLAPGDTATLASRGWAGRRRAAKHSLLRRPHQLE